MSTAMNIAAEFKLHGVIQAARMVVRYESGAARDEAAKLLKDALAEWDRVATPGSDDGE